MKPLMFFRNDDIRGTLDTALQRITQIFLDRRVPIIHAVEPANVTREVSGWLLEVKRAHPDLVDFMQHGYDHVVKNTVQKGEYGGQRTYEEQHADILRGRKLMDEHFGDQWFNAFNFPYGAYNEAAVRAVNDCGFAVLNSHDNIEWKRRVFYAVGHLLRQGRLLNHHVSWNLKTIPGTRLLEIDMNVGFIRRYLNEGVDSVMFSLGEMKTDTMRYARRRSIGVLLHHRYHTSEEHFALVEDYLDWAAESGLFTFARMSDVHAACAR